MKSLFFLSALITFSANAAEIHPFNGKDLTGWEGDPKFWSVKDGALTASSSKENPVPHNTFLIWKDGEVSDFTLTLEYKMTPLDDKSYTNSGIQYRSAVIDAEKFIVGGYQADIEYGKKYSGILYEEKGRGVLAKRGEKVVITAGETPAKPKLEVVGKTGDPEEIQAAIDRDGRHTYRIVAKGNHLQHFINDQLTVDVTDKTAEAPASGILALQMHQGPPMQIQFKQIVILTED